MLGPAWTRDGPDIYLPCCGGNHDPDPPDVEIRFKGRAFRAPFRCLCCAREICARQFAFGRACGYCDTGSCYKDGVHPIGGTAEARAIFGNARILEA